MINVLSRKRNIEVKALKQIRSEFKVYLTQLRSCKKQRKTTVHILWTTHWNAKQHVYAYDSPALSMMWIKAVQQWTTTVKGSSKTAHQNWYTLGPSLHRAPLGQHFDETSLLKTTFVQEVFFCFVFCFGSPTDRRHQNKTSKLNTLFLFVPLLLLANQDRVPSDTQFAHLWRTRTNCHPLQVCPVRGVDPVNLLVRSVFTL